MTKQYTKINLYFQKLIEDLKSRGYTPDKSTIDLAYSNKEGFMDKWKDTPKLLSIYYSIRRFFIDVFEKAFSLRYYKYLFFRLRYGFDPADCWNLDYAFIKWALPRMKHFKKEMERIPFIPGSLEGEENAEEKWNNIVDSVIWSLEFYNYEYKDFASKEDWNKAEEGMILFAKYLTAFWI